MLAMITEEKMDPSARDRFDRTETLCGSDFWTIRTHRPNEVLRGAFGTAKIDAPFEVTVSQPALPPGLPLKTRQPRPALGAPPAGDREPGRRRTLRETHRRSPSYRLHSL